MELAPYVELLTLVVAATNFYIYSKTKSKMMLFLGVFLVAVTVATYFVRKS